MAPTMSYKFPLTGLAREGKLSLTQQLVDRFAAAIEHGDLAPGEKLPPTRTLAADAEINHLTAARVYRKLAEEGYVTATVGRGTFVRALVPAAAEAQGDDWQSYVLPDRQASYQEEILSDAFRLAHEEGMISLATGFPSPRFHPTDELAEISAQMWADEGKDAISYTTPEGLLGLRERIAEGGKKRGFAEGPEEIIVTSGCQQAIDVAVRAIVEPGDVVVVESPTFVGTLAALRSTGARVIGIPVDENGFDVDALEHVLTRHEVKLCALQPACQNPTGTDLAPERRSRLTQLALERNFFVLEDGVYGDLRYDGKKLDALRRQAPGHVVHVNSLSKVVGGGLRIGWIAARGPVLERMTMLKQGTDFHTSTPIQHIAARYLATNAYARNIDESLPYYRERRDVLMDALATHLEGEVHADVPHGGHHVWVTLNRPVEERMFYSEAVRHGVSFTPGGAITVDRPQRTSFRLSFSLLEPEDLEEGVRRLARALREVRRSSRTAVAAPLS
ncbi:MAG: PLP-dependent aminotransferase family protein [Thermoleophilaceae bacterium]|nr:PLP-dependent aminotransferase family protein [Thermoleophilaceae bacterium]